MKLVSTVISPRLIPAVLLFLLCGCLTASGQRFNLSDTSEASDSEGESLRDLFEQGEYFEGDGEDSLSELLKKARELDASDEAVEKIEDEEPSQPDRDDNELSEDEPTDAIDQSIDAEEENEEASQAEKELEAQNARQRALAMHLQRLQKPLHQVRLAAANSPLKQAPTNRASAAISHQSSRWVTATNAAPKRAERYPIQLAHQPLYFEEPNLERCGQGYGCLQNLVSSGHFLFNTAILPYRLATQPAKCLVRSSGDCRTCESFPTNIEPLVDGGENARGFLTEAASIAGFTFLLL